MMRLIKHYFILFMVFSIGFFVGEWLLDILLSSARNELKKEIIESIIMGAIVAFLFVVSNRTLMGDKIK